MMSLYDYDDDPVNIYVRVPLWIDQGITTHDVAAIIQGGCESGAYMPAVEYYTAVQTMNNFGDDIFNMFDNDTIHFIAMQEAPKGWHQLACGFVSAAVEMWACRVEEDLIDEIRIQLNDEEE